MCTHDAQPSDSEVVLAALLEEVEQLIKAGQPIDLQKYRTEHPEHFGELCRLLSVLKMLHEAGL